MKRKILKATINLNGKDKTFTAHNQSNVLESQGLRIQCAIQFGGGAVSPTATIKIYGLELQNMLDLMRIQWNTMSAILNTIRIDFQEEGDTTFTKVYEGNITFAKINFEGTPDVSLDIQSQMAIVEQLRPQDPITFLNDTDAATMIEQIAKSMNFQFENTKKASKIIANGGTYEGSNLDKIKKIAQAADFDVYIEQNLIAICPKGFARDIKVPIISPKNGLIGYPVPDIRGITFRCLFNPLVRFGGIVTIKDSILTTCNGDWRVYGCTIMLESNFQGGKWEMEVSASPKNSKDLAIAK